MRLSVRTGVTPFAYLSGVTQLNRKPLVRTLALALLAFSLQACSRPQSPEEPCGFVQNPDRQRVSWGRSLPVKLYVHDSVPVEAYEALDRAVAQYNQNLGGGREVFRIIARGVGGALNPTKDGYNMIYWFDTWDADRRSEQARTTIYWSGSEIFEADIRINGAGFRYHFGVNSDFFEVDLESLMVHELGHALGLAHNVNHGSVMNFTLDHGQDRRKLGEPDVANLRCEY